MKENKIFHGWFVVIGCLLITATMVPPIMSLNSKYLIDVTTELQISRSAFTFANTLLQALGIFLSPIIAKRLATGNLKRTLVISIIGYVLAYASYSLAQSAIHLYISSLFLGVFYLNATILPVSMTITNWFVKKRGLAMSIAMAGIGVGGTIFSQLITGMLANYGWRHTYQIMALIILVLALPSALFLIRKTPQEIGLKPYGSEEAAASASSATVKKDTTLTISLSEAKTKVFFWIFIFGVFCNGLINTGSLGQFPPALQELQGPAVQATIISMYSMIGIFGKLFIGWLNDRFGIVVSTAFGCICFALSFVFILLGSNVTMLYIMAVLFGLGNPIGTVTPPLITSAIFGSEKYGEAYGFANSFQQIGLTLGSLMVAGIYDATGTYNPAWILLMILTLGALVGWVGSYFMSRKYHA